MSAVRQGPEGYEFPTPNHRVPCVVRWSIDAPVPPYDLLDVSIFDPSRCEFHITDCHLGYVGLDR